MKLSNYIKLYPYHEKQGYTMVYSCKKASTTLLPNSILQCIKSNSLSDEVRSTLEDLGIIVPDIEVEKKEMAQYINRQNGQRTQANVIAVMNLDCNLACSYCFEGGMKGHHYMSEETAETLINYTASHIFKDKDLHFVFYGGEPLLSKALIKHIAIHLKNEAQIRERKFSFGMVTNGTLLTHKTVTELLPYGLISAKVTLDGPSDIHDRSRPFKSGGGSFALIAHNIKTVCKHIKVQIGGNYTESNYREFPRLLDHLLDNGLTVKDIHRIKFDAVTKTRKDIALPDYNEGAESVNVPWVLQSSIFLREEILKRGYKTPRVLPSPCMMEMNDDIVVNYNGDIYKCPALIGSKNYCIGSINSGISDYRHSHNLDSWKNTECLNCEYLPLCFGGCRFLNIVQNSTIEGTDCRKTYYDAALESLVKQEMRYK
ncbi:MAG: geopeptide radical SAM maturase [Nitrospira sp.]|nr:geopeptide radical SAM maturase [Nitrospira sp.]